MCKSESKKELKNLLAKLRQFHPHYGNRLAMHLPMVLTALHRLGASRETLQQQFNANIDNLEPIRSTNSLKPITSVSQHLGQSEQYEAYLEYFTARIAREGVEPVLREALPILMPGVAASHFTP